MNYKHFKIFLISCFTIISIHSNAQRTLQGDGTGTVGGNINFNGQGVRKNTDTSFQHRDPFADSLTIYFKYFDKSKTQFLDSSINDFYTRFPLPYYYNHLGNLATAAKSLLFSPNNLQAGFDAGFHQYDVYNYTLENTRLFQSTKPYTELTYLLGSSAEQMINVVHTQNKTQNLNYSLEYRFINSPGVLKNQNASVNNVRLTLNYQSPNKRYHLTTVYFSNKNASSENGGTNDYKQLDSLALSNPFELAVRLGPGNVIRRSLFSTAVYTGNTYKNNQFTVRQQYDLGQKDSIVTDTSVVKLFYPTYRLQHQLSFKTSSYWFNDLYADSANYKKNFNYDIKGNQSGYYDTISFKDAYTHIENEFSIISFPDKKNAAQFLKASATIQNIFGKFNDSIKNNYYNISISGEYRNRTKNKVWDIEANAQLYLNGLNAGDYSAFISLQKLLSKRAGSLEIGFQNVNKSPSFIYTNQSSFLVKNRDSYNKENTTRIWANYLNKKLSLSITGEYFLMSNFLYFDSIFSARQEATLFNVLHIGLEKKFILSKHWNWYAEVHLQQTTANAPVNIPQILTRQRLAFEGNFFTNLFLSMGLELRYHSNYNASGYSPFNGQFFYQDSYTANNRPDINLFFNFRIKSFKAFVRAENLNTLIPPSGYKKYNYHTEQYPMQSVWMRLGIWWNFVN
ncbi:MAG: putative porin [Chitinophagaceae bacterium]